MNISNSKINGLAALLSLILIYATPSSGQITINIPKFPKIKKDKPQPQTNVQTEVEGGAGPVAAASNTSSPAADCTKDPATEIHLEDVEKTRKEAEDFRPGLRQFYVSEMNHSKNIYLEAALLPWQRTEFLGKRDAEFVNCMNPALDRLAATARKTISSYTGPTNYNLGTPAEKKVLLSAITGVEKAKILKVGILQPNWLIEKDSFNFPTSRYKHGVVIFKNPEDEFCWLFWVNIVQQYAGGGTYGASYGNYVGRSLSGCPAAK